MAKQLSMPGSQLSEVMNGKANLSAPRARKVAIGLGLTGKEIEIFCVRVQLESAKDLRTKEALLEQLRRLTPKSARRVSDLETDVYHQIADWQHSAILELLDIPQFEFNPQSIGEKLGISRLAAEVAVDRLSRLGLIGQDSFGQWQRWTSDLQFTAINKSEALFAFYRSMMEKASAALETQDLIKERISGYQTFALSKEALPEMDQAIDEFFETMLRISKKYPKKTDVYNLSIHFFNLTPSRKVRRK